MIYNFNDEFPQTDNIWDYSNPREVADRAKKFYGVKIYRSTRPSKKYMVFDRVTGRRVHFGQMFYDDYTKHRDEDRRHNYLVRSGNIRGNWRTNPFSANFLSRCLLW